MPDSATPALPLPTEAEAKFDASADWGSDSSAANTVTGSEAAGGATEAESTQPPATATAEIDLESEQPAAEPEIPRNDAGQFVKKGKGKPRSDPQARVEAATAKEAAAKEEARQAKQELDVLRSRLAALESRPVPTVARNAESPRPIVEPSSFPTFDDWLKQNPGKEWDAYNDARTEHQATRIAEQIVAQRLGSFQAQQQFQTTAQAHQARVDAAKANYPDWDQVIETGNQALTAGLNARGLTFPFQIFQAALFESPRGPEMLRYLAEHPDDAIQLAVQAQNLPVSAAPMLRSVLESKLPPAAAPSKPDSAQVAPISTAKPPINRVGGSASATPVDPDDIEFGPEYIRVENERERKRAAMGRW